MLAERSLSWSSTTQWSHSSTTTQLLWLLDTQAKSEHSQASIVLTWGLEIAKGSCHTSAWKESLPPLRLYVSWAFPHNSSHPVNLQCYAQAAWPERQRRNTHCLPFAQRCVCSSCPSWQLLIQAHAIWLVWRSQTQARSASRVWSNAYTWPVPTANILQLQSDRRTSREC